MNQSFLHFSAPARGLAYALVLTGLCASSGPVWASSSLAATASTEPEEGPDLSEVRDLYEQGRAKFETFDYRGAVEAWTLVYAKLGDTPTERQIRNDVIYNIAMAQERAFELDHDVAHLRQALALLRKYVDEYKTLYQATPEGRKEVAGVEARIEELELRITQATGEVSTPAEASSLPPPPGATHAEPATPQPVPRKTQVRNLLRNDPVISRQYRRGRSMTVAGGVLLGVGGIMMIGVLSVRPLYEGWTIPQIAVMSVGGSLMAGGAVLLGVGIPIRRKAIRTAESRVVFAPSLRPDALGWTARMSF